MSTVYFVFLICMPVIIGALYSWRLDQRKLNRTFREDWKRTVNLTIFALLMMIVCSIGLGLLGDINITITEKRITTNQISWRIVLTFISIIIILIFRFFALTYRNKRNDKYFFLQLKKYKKRVALFLLTIFYFPICQGFLETLTCEDQKSDLFNQILCYKGKWTFTLIHLISWILGPIYGIGIPIVFIYLIRRGICVVDRSYGIHHKEKQIAHLKAELKERERNGNYLKMNGFNMTNLLKQWILNMQKL